MSPILLVHSWLFIKDSLQNNIDEKYLFKYRAMAVMLRHAAEVKEVFFCSGGWGCGANVQIIIFIAVYISRNLIRCWKRSFFCSICLQVANTILYLLDLQQHDLCLFYYGSTSGVKNTFMEGKMSLIHVILSMRCHKRTQSTVYHTFEYTANNTILFLNNAAHIILHICNFHNQF